MANDNSRPDVAVFIDFENVYVSVRDKLDANPNFESIMDRCSELGRVVISRAYADWYRYPRVTSALYANGVEPMYVPTYYYDKDMGRTGRAIKNSADMNMCIDAMKTLFTNTNIAKFVLVTGDRDFIPLVNMIRQQGKDVIIIGIGGAASTHLAQSADEFIFYEQLIGKTTQPTARETNRERDRQRPERQRPAEAEVEPVVATPAPAPVEQPSEPDPFDTLVEAVHLARKRGYVCTLGSLKLVMKELMGGEFKESRYKDVSGRPFTKFKDFVQDAERRGKVQIFTSGTINEVFLPGEDPYKLSQFAGDLKEEPVDLKVDIPASANGRQPPRAGVVPSESTSSGPNGRSRRRRRSRGGRQIGQPSALHESTSPEEDIDELAEATIDSEEELTALAADDVFDTELDYYDSDDPSLIPDELLALPTDDEAIVEDIPDLDRLEGLDLDLEDSEDSDSPSYGMDEVELLAQAEAADEAAAALIAEYADEQRADDESPALPEFTAPEDVTSEGVQEAEVVIIEQPAAQAAEATTTIFLPFIVVPEPPARASQVVETPAEPNAELAEEAPASEPAQPEAEAEIVSEPAQAEAEPNAAETPSAEVETLAAGETETPAAEAILFSDEEWQIFREMMAGFTKPVSFAQIFDSLRGLRQAQRLTRTNEQLRTLAKQAINSGMLERSGRGTRVYYRLPQTEE